MKIRKYAFFLALLALGTSPSIASPHRGYVSDPTVGEALKPQEFGAKCNGRGDDTAALAKMIAESASRGLAMEIASGTCMATALTISGTNQSLTVDRGAILKQVPLDTRDTFIALDGNGESIHGPGTIDGSKSLDHNFVPCVAMNAPHITLAGDLTIRNCNGYGVLSQDQPFATISGLNVVNTGYVGVFFKITGLSAVEGVSISHLNVDRTAQADTGPTSCGLCIHGTENAYFTNAVINGVHSIGATASAARVGPSIELWYLDRAKLSHFSSRGGYIGISLIDVNNSSVVDMQAEGGVFAAIEIGASSGNVISNLKANGNGTAKFGITLDTGSNTDDKISAITSSETTGRGLFVIDAHDISFKNIHIDNPGSEPAIYLTNSQRFSLADGDLEGHSRSTKGIVLEESWNGSITGLNIKNFSQNGVLLVSKANSLSGITISRNSFSNVNIPFASQLSGNARLGSGVRLVGNSGIKDQ